MTSVEENQLQVIPSEKESMDELKKESINIINQVVAEKDIDKTKDLTYLFNINQNKKTMARVNKLNDLLDVITDQAIARFSQKPDNISNQELLQGLKVVQDIIERGQKQVSGVNDQPLIQINNQDNSVNVGGASNMTRDSRERVKSAVMGILSGLGIEEAVMPERQEDVIDVSEISTAEQEESK